MKIFWFKKLINGISRRKSVFIIKSDDTDVDDIIQTLSKEVDVDVDVYSNCKELFFALNKHKLYYDWGVMSKSDKRNVGDVLSDMIKYINPNIILYTYTDKNTLKHDICV